LFQLGQILSKYILCKEGIKFNLYIIIFRNKHFLSATFSILSVMANDMTAFQNDWISKGEALVINQAVKDNLSAQGFDIKVLTPIVCGMKRKKYNLIFYDSLVILRKRTYI
jgi:hypothetical protein